MLKCIKMIKIFFFKNNMKFMTIKFYIWGQQKHLLERINLLHKGKWNFPNISFNTKHCLLSVMQLSIIIHDDRIAHETVTAILSGSFQLQYYNGSFFSRSHCNNIHTKKEKKKNHSRFPNQIRISSQSKCSSQAWCLSNIFI